MAIRISLDNPPTGLDSDIQYGDDLSYCVTPLLITLLRWYLNINRFPIAYVFQPRLRDRLTLSGLTLLRKP